MTFRRNASPLFAALMEENGGSLTDGTKKEARIMSRLKICLKSGQEAQDSESLGGCCATMKVRIQSTARPVAATSNKCSHQQEMIYRWIRTVASLTFDPSHSKTKGGTLVIEKISAKYCGWSARSGRSLSLDVASAYCSVQACTMCRSERAWFLHDLSGDASQLSLPCMIRLECRHDVFHALGDARDK